jgi:hypothetical protein
MTRTVSEVQYIPKQSRVNLEFREGRTVQYRWINAQGETELLATVAAARAAFERDGFASLERAS